MPLAARWRSIDRLPEPRGRDKMPGVYELADEHKRVIYIGQSASDVPGRIRQHLARPGPVRDLVRYWRYAYSRVPQADEASLLAAYREAHGGELPTCNTARPLPRDAARRFAERFRAHDT